MDTLEELVVSGKELNRELVASVLKPFLRIDGATCTIIPDARWQTLSNEAKVLQFLLARKAMVALDLPLEHEGATPAEIEQETDVKGGSIRPALKKFFDQKTLTKSNDGRYFVPNYSIERLKSLSKRWLEEARE